MLKGSPEGGRNCPGPGPDLQQAALSIVTHYHPARVAGQALGRVEGADQLEQARGGGVEVGGQLGDLVAELVQLGGVMNSKRAVLHGEPSFSCGDSTPCFFELSESVQDGQSRCAK
jgi:hypothetical protein